MLTKLQATLHILSSTFFRSLLLGPVPGDYWPRQDLGFGRLGQFGNISPAYLEKTIIERGKSLAGK